MVLSVFNIVANLRAFFELQQIFRLRGRLIYELTKRELLDRYTGQVFGMLWTIGHPLIMIVIYVFIFGFVFRMRIGGSLELPLDYTSYMLAGVIPWLTFSEVIGKSSTVIITNSNVVKQVVFPIEVLPIKSVLASLVTELVLLFLLATYTLIANQTLPWTYAILPILILFQTLAMIGLTYLFSAIGPYFRDLKDFVQIFLSVAFFTLPILYLPAAVPKAIRPLLFANPLSYMIWCFQDVLYFGTFRHPWAWLVFICSSLLLFIFGYRTFRKLKVMFGNVL
jgi:lipopolysaccharide transport system permease protein